MRGTGRYPWITIFKPLRSAGKRSGKQTMLTALSKTQPDLNIMCWTCSRTPLVRGCMSVTLWAISQVMFLRGTNGIKDSTYSTPWDTTVLVFPPNNTPFKRANTRRLPPKQTSTGTGSSWSKWGSAMTGRVKCAPATRNITVGPNGFLASFLNLGMMWRPTKHGLFPT